MALEALLDVLELQGGLSQKVVSGAPADRNNVVRSVFIPPSVRDKSFLKGVQVSLTALQTEAGARFLA